MDNQWDQMSKNVILLLILAFPAILLVLRGFFSFVEARQRLNERKHSSDVALLAALNEKRAGIKWICLTQSCGADNPGFAHYCGKCGVARAVDAGTAA
jgi:ribosomal protein L40E